MNFPPLSISEREKSLRNKKKTIKIDEEYFMHETVSPSGALGVTYTEWRSARLPNIGKNIPIVVFLLFACDAIIKIISE